MNEILIPVFWHWWALAALLLLIELLAPGLYCLWLAGSALLTGTLLLAGINMTTGIQLITFSLLAVVGIGLARRWLKRHPITSDHPLLNQRTAGYVGRVVRLEQAIVDGKGRLNLDGSIWTVSGEDSPAQSLVRITGIDGLTLRVERVKP